MFLYIYIIFQGWGKSSDVCQVQSFGTLASAVHYSRVQLSKVEYSKSKYSRIQQNTVQYIGKYSRVQ